MISFEFFEEKFGEYKELLGWRVTESRAKLIYEKIYEFEKSDLIRTLEIISYSDKFSFAEFIKTLRTQYAMRVEKEVEDQKKREEREFLKWWKSLRGTIQVCQHDNDCFKCPIQYCDIIAREATKAIKQVVSGNITEKQMNERLSKFKGMGWESDIPEQQAF